MPLLVLYGIVLLATPVLLFFFYLQFDKFRKRIKEMEERNASQAAAFTREIAELKKQIAANRPAPPAERPVELTNPTEAPAPPAPLSPVRPPIPPAITTPVPPVVLPPAVELPAKPIVPPQPPAADLAKTFEPAKPV